jgi:hypothetical protein
MDIYQFEISRELKHTQYGVARVRANSKEEALEKAEAGEGPDVLFEWHDLTIPITAPRPKVPQLFQKPSPGASPDDTEESGGAEPPAEA